MLKWSEETGIVNVLEDGTEVQLAYEQVAAAHGLIGITLKRRLLKGYPLERVLDPDFKPDRKPIRRGVGVLDHLEQWFPSESKMAAAHGVTLGAYSSRKHNGHTLEDCLNPNFDSKSKPITLEDGTTYKSRQELAKKLGVTTGAITNRITRGLTPEDIAKKPKRYHLQVEYKGKVYPSMKHLCEAKGINYDTFMYRRRHGATLEAALIPPNHGKA